MMTNRPQNPLLPDTAERKTGWFSRPRNRQVNDWMLDQLNIQPYQHLLEMGYGAGHLTEQAARMLKIGFIAGIESSVSLYQQAYRRNRSFIRQQLLQLHIGEPFELSYPPHYFHTIYGANVHHSCRDVSMEVLRLTSLLKHKGRLVLFLETGHNRSGKDIHKTAGQLQEDYHSAGLNDIYMEQPQFAYGNLLAVIGFKA